VENLGGRPVEKILLNKYCFKEFLFNISNTRLKKNGKNNIKIKTISFLKKIKY
jgi:hypothetical protein